MNDSNVVRGPRAAVSPRRAVDSIRIGLVGHGFMGRAHALGWRMAAQMLRIPARIELVAVAGRDVGRVTAAAERLGFGEALSDWRPLVEREDIDVIDICTPVGSHSTIAESALAAGKHVLCEKPLTRTSVEARRLADLARRASGQRAMVGFNYRRVPALAFARDLVATGRIGTPVHFRATYLQDWLVDPSAPWSWRLDADEAGAGALADLGSHLIDLAAYLCGTRLTEVNGAEQTLVGVRRLADRVSPDSRDSERAVTVDDSCAFIARGADNLLATFAMSRCAPGRKNQLALAIDGTKGSIAFDLERLNELQFHDATDEPETAGFRTIMVTEPTHPYVRDWWPPGHVLGWDHTFAHQAVDFAAAVVNGTPCSPNFEDGLYVQEVIDGVLASIETGQWTHLGSVEDLAPAAGDAHALDR